MSVTPGDLTRTIAELLGLSLNTVKNYDRKLMEAGLRSKKGHGRGSATMTPADAVSLLIGAACVGIEITKIASAVEAVRSLPWPVDDKADSSSKADDPELQSLSKFLKREASELRAFGPAMDSIMSYLVESGDQNSVFSFQITTAAGLPLVATILISGSPFAQGKVQKLHFLQLQGLGKKMLAPALQVRSEVNWEVTLAVANLLSSRASQ